MSPSLKAPSVAIVSIVNNNLNFSTSACYCSLHPFFCILSADNVQPGTAECPAAEIGNYSCRDKIAQEKSDLLQRKFCSDICG